MAEEQQVLAAPFPAPPPFFGHFTANNLARLDEIKASSTAGAELEGESADPNGSDGVEPSLDIPPELRYLVPPAPPPDGKYRSFGDRWDINETLPTLAAAGVPQLYSSSLQLNGDIQSTSNPAIHLKALLRSTLLSFLELINLLSANPAAAFAKVEDFHILFLNMHHLINEYRPHQARETLILMMEEQIERRQAEVEGMKHMRKSVEEVLRGLGEEDQEEGVPSDRNMDGVGLPYDAKMVVDIERDCQMRAHLRIWDALDEIEV